MIQVTLRLFPASENGKRSHNITVGVKFSNLEFPFSFRNSYAPFHFVLFITVHSDALEIARGKHELFMGWRCFAISR